MTIDRDWLKDEIVLSLTESDVTRRCKEYSVSCSVFQQPSAWRILTGDPTETAAAIREQHKKGDPFEIRLQRFDVTSGEYDLDVPIQTGRIDAADVPDTEETTVEFRGRDNMAALLDSHFKQDDSVTEATFYDLTAKHLRAVGFDPAEWLVTGEPSRETSFTSGGGGMRRGAAAVRSGETTVEHLDYVWPWAPNTGATASQTTRINAPSASTPSVDAQTLLIETVTGGQPKTELKTLKAKVGQQRYAWLKDQYKRVGLFLWCIPNGQFALSVPNATQDPAFRLQRLLDGKPGDNNILSGGLKDDSVQRYSHTLVFGRAGGGKEGRGRIMGEFVDQEMVDGKLLKEFVLEDDNVKTQKAADMLARRTAADMRRASRELIYTVSGHSAPSLLQPGKRFPFYVNCMVHVRDEKLGIDDNFYLGDVEFSRSMGGGTKARVQLYWPEDLVFEEG